MRTKYGLWLPDDRQAIENKWIFKKKTDADGNVTVYKAYIPTPRCMHQSIDGSLEFVYFVNTFRIDKNFWLHHIQLFFKKFIKECSFDVHLPDFIKYDNS